MRMWWELRKLNSGDMMVRVRAMRSLGDWKDRRAVDRLLTVLGEEPTVAPGMTHRLGSFFDQGGAAEALGKIGDTRAVDPLLAIFDRWLPFSGQEAPLNRFLLTVVDALASIGDIRSSSSLVRALRSADPVLQSRAAEALSKLNWTPSNAEEKALYSVATGDWLSLDGEDAVEPLLAYLARHWRSQGQRATARPALDALQRIGHLAMPRLIEMAQDDHIEVRCGAIEALGNIRSHEVVGALRDALAGAPHKVRVAVVRALGREGSDAAVACLVEMLSDPNDVVSKAAAGALRRPNWQPTNATEEALIAVAVRDWPRASRNANEAAPLLLRRLEEWPRSGEDASGWDNSRLRQVLSILEKADPQYVGERLPTSLINLAASHWSRTFKLGVWGCLSSLGLLAARPLLSLPRESVALRRIRGETIDDEVEPELLRFSILKAIIEHLAESTDPSSTDIISCALEDWDIGIRRAALRYVIQQRDHRTLDALLVALRDSDDTVLEWRRRLIDGYDNETMGELAVSALVSFQDQKAFHSLRSVITEIDIPYRTRLAASIQLSCMNDLDALSCLGELINPKQAPSDWPDRLTERLRCAALTTLAEHGIIRSFPDLVSFIAVPELAFSAVESLTIIMKKYAHDIRTNDLANVVNIEECIGIVYEEVMDHWGGVSGYVEVAKERSVDLSELHQLACLELLRRGIEAD